MTRTEHLLTIVSEECAEVSQRVTKALRFGLEEVQPGQDLTNAQRVMYEFNDLMAVMGILNEEGAFGVGGNIDIKAIEKKRAKIEKYLSYSKECGTLTEQSDSHE